VAFGLWWGSHYINGQGPLESVPSPGQRNRNLVWVPLKAGWNDFFVRYLSVFGSWDFYLSVPKDANLELSASGAHGDPFAFASAGPFSPERERELATLPMPLDPTALEIVVFIIAIWGAYLVRSMFQGTIGMLNFWTTRGAAVFDLYMATEMLLSGRLVPLQLMPQWVQTLANFLPFKWTFGFPIEALVGNLSTQSLLLGLCAQALWIGIGLVLFKLAWSSAIKRFVSVGN
jgi:hypothetical protein